MDTIDGALKSKDGQRKFYPETTIANVIGLEAQLAKAITNLTANGGTITITKADGTTSTITVATSTSAGGGGGVTGVKGNAETEYRTGNVNITAANIGAATTDIATATKAGLMSAELFTKLDNIEAGAQKNSTALATTTSNGLMSFEDKTLLYNLSSTSVTGVKGSAETEYRTGNINITAANIGLGSVNNTADSAKTVAKANQLTTARTIRTNLASTSTASFNGTADITPGVTGTLPIANGGTGATSLSSVSVGSAATCTGNSATATKATQDESGNNIKSSYAASISISGHTITLKNKNGGSLGTVTVPDDDTDTKDLTKMSGILPVANGGTGRNDGLSQGVYPPYLTSTNLSELYNGFFFVHGNVTDAPFSPIIGILFSFVSATPNYPDERIQFFFAYPTLNGAPTGIYARTSHPTRTGISWTKLL